MLRMLKIKQKLKIFYLAASSIYDNSYASERIYLSRFKTLEYIDRLKRIYKIM